MHLLSERNDSEKATYCMIPTKQQYGKSRTMATVKKISSVQGLRGEG